MRRAVRAIISRGRPDRKVRGVVDGALTGCPRSPCCVASTATSPSHRIDPIRIVGDSDEVRARILELLESWPEATVLEAVDGYVHAECQTPALQFVDDLELLVDGAAGVVHVRSCSRIGTWDFGVNRRRIERLRRALETG